MSAEVLIIWLVAVGSAAWIIHRALERMHERRASRQEQVNQERMAMISAGIDPDELKKLKVRLTSQERQATAAMEHGYWISDPNDQA